LPVTLWVSCRAQVLSKFGMTAGLEI